MAQQSDQWQLNALSESMQGQSFLIERDTSMGRSDDTDITITEGAPSRRHATIFIDDKQLYVEDLGSTNGTFVNDIKVTKSALKNGDVLRIHLTEFKVVGPEDDDKTQMQSADATMVQGADATMMQGADATMVQNGDATQIAGGMETQVVAAISVDGENAGAADGWRQSKVTDLGTRIVSAAKPTLVGLNGAHAGKRYVVNRSGATLGRNGGNDVVVQDASISGQHATISEQNGSWRVKDEGSSNGTYVNGKKVDSSPLEPNDKIVFGKVELRFELQENKPAVQGQPASPNVMPKKSQGTPAWLYAVGSFVLVAVAAGVFFTQQDNVSEPAPQVAAVEPEATNKLSKQWLEHDLKSGTPTGAALIDIDSNGANDVLVAYSDGVLRGYDGLGGLRLLDIELGAPVVAAPLVHDLDADGTAEIIAVDTAGRVSVFDNKKQLKWRLDDHLGAVYRSPQLAHLTEDNVADLLVASAARGLVAVDGANGNLLWSSQSITDGMLIAEALVADVNSDGVLDYVTASSTGQVQAFSLQNGTAKPLWQYQSALLTYASPVLVGVNNQSVVVLATHQSGLLGLSASTGEVLWRSLSDQSVTTTPVIMSDNSLLVATQSGQISLIDPSNGAVTQNVQLDMQIESAPVVVNAEKSDVMVLGNKGKLQWLSMQDGSIHLQGHISGADAFVASPLVISQDAAGAKVVLMSENGAVFNYSLN